MIYNDLRGIALLAGLILRRHDMALDKRMGYY
jgi:hypothetical protein